MAWRFPEKPPRWVILLLVVETFFIIPTTASFALITAYAFLHAHNQQDWSNANFLAMVTVMSAVPLGQWHVIRTWKQMADRVNPPITSDSNHPPATQ